jgi:hypothetical protein
MTSRQLVLILVILIGLGIIFTVGKMLMNPSTVPTPTPSVSVSATPTPTSSGTNSGIGSPVTAQGITLTPLNVLEDSRCPLDVQCIQAGTVRLLARIAGNATSSDRVLVLNQPLTVGSSTITMSEVTPAPYSGVKLTASQYKFKFDIK